MCSVIVFRSSEQTKLRIIIILTRLFTTIFTLGSARDQDRDRDLVHVPARDPAAIARAPARVHAVVLAAEVARLRINIATSGSPGLRTAVEADRTLDRVPDPAADKRCVYSDLIIFYHMYDLVNKHSSVVIQYYIANFCFRWAWSIDVRRIPPTIKKLRLNIRSIEDRSIYLAHTKATCFFFVTCTHITP